MLRRAALVTLIPLALGAACAEAPPPAPETARDQATIARLPPAAFDPTPAAGPRKPKIAAQAPERVTADADFRQTRPVPTPEPPFTVPAAKRFTLADGLPVVLLTDHRLPLVTVQVMIKTGATADPTGKAGLADLVANMLDEGTATRSSVQISDGFEQIGATYGARAGWDSSSVSVSALTENIATALAIWADVVQHPAFAPAELDRVRANLLAGIAQQKDNPPAIANVVFSRALYGDKHPFGWPAIGTESTVPTITVEDLKKFHADHYRPKNAILVVAGDYEEADVRATIAPLVADWKGADSRRAVAGPAAAPKKNHIYLCNKDGAPQSSIRIGLPGIARKSPDYYRAMVMNDILGGTFRRLSLNLREKRGWTYGVYSHFSPGRGAGPWVVAGEFVADKTADSVAEILREIRALRDGDVTAAELAESKAGIVKAFPARFSTARDAAAQWAEVAMLDLPARELETFRAAVDKVTIQDVRAMARKYLQPDRLVITVVGDRKAHEAALRKIADVELRDADGNPIKS